MRVALAVAPTAGSERVTGIKFCVENGAALNSAHRPPGTFWKRIACHVTVVGWIGKNDQAESFVFLGQPGFNAPVIPAVAR